MTVRNLLLGLSLVTSTAALAAEAPAARSPMLDDLKAKCADFVNNPQMKPVKVQITCNELAYYWKALPNKDAVLPGQRTVGVSVELKGSHLAPGMFPIKAEGTKISCQQFVKTERQVGNIDVELSCQDIAAINDLGAYCAPLIVSRTATDPGLVKETATREMLSFCPNSELPTPPALNDETPAE